MALELLQDFPLLRTRSERGRRLVYLDSAATSQKPDSVIDAIAQYYRTKAANPHRGAYALSEDATELYEQARAKTAAFLHAQEPGEVVFTAGATSAINLVALSYGQEHVVAGDEILITIAEHHANLLPWQRLAQRKGATLRYVYTAPDGSVSMEDFRAAIHARTKIVAINHVSNVLGTVNPVVEIARLAHAQGAVVLVDAAQSIPHMPVDVQAMGADFLAFSAHKMLGPAGFGVLYGKRALLAGMDPLLLGGGIVEDVQEQTVRFMDAPWRFEAGTPPVEGAVGLAAAIDYLTNVGFETIQHTEQKLVSYALERLQAMPEVTLYGSPSAAGRTGVIAFNVQDAHPHDVASILNDDGIAIRAGHHCAQPLMKHLGVHSTCRASFYLYNTLEDVDLFVHSLANVRKVLGL
ncbi:MAG: SufS family cysteine desulfurase [Candidatus Limiplasma sp.]|nr:SufS family cysteine desulfurase [Candidatus Limiplasma sp.]